MSTLVIVESPTKARTIRNYLPAGYRVEASMGHVRDLPRDATEIPAAVKGEDWAKLGVNIESNFEPLYVIPKDKKKIVKEAVPGRANGLFLYAKLAMRTVLEPGVDVCQVIKKLPNMVILAIKNIHGRGCFNDKMTY